MMGTWWQELVVAGHIVSAVRNERERGTPARAPQAHSEVCVHGDSKACQVDNVG